MAKKFISLRVVTAKNSTEARKKVENGEFDEADPLCDKIIDYNQFNEAMNDYIEKLKED